MIISTLLILILSNAVTLRRGKSILYSRIVITIAIAIAIKNSPAKPHAFTSLTYVNSIGVGLNAYILNAVALGIVTFYNNLSISFCYKTIKSSAKFKIIIAIFTVIMFCIFKLEANTIILILASLIIVSYIIVIYIKHMSCIQNWITGLTILTLTLFFYSFDF